jgi:hypothetical protein
MVTATIEKAWPPFSEDIASILDRYVKRWQR